MADAKKRRKALSKERILVAAVELADEIGVDALTIRKLATALDTAPMSIYHHLGSKDEIIDGMVEVVFSEIALPPEDLPWQAAIRVRCESARDTMRRHPWAPPLMESRVNPGPQNLGHHEAVLECLQRGGLPTHLVAHAYAILDAFIYGFSFQEAVLPWDSTEELEALADAFAEADVFGPYPSLARFTEEHVLQPGYDFGDSFGFGLDLIIGGIQRAADE